MGWHGRLDFRKKEGSMEEEIFFSKWVLTSKDVVAEKIS